MKFALLLPVIGLIGCTHTYVPTVSRSFEPIPEFHATGEIALKNDQPVKDPIVFFSNGVHKWQSSRHQLTATAIEIATQELKIRGLQVKEESRKSLSLSVVSISTSVGAVKIESTIHMRVTTGDGYTTTYIADNTAYMAAVLKRQWDGVIMRAVVEMLKDPKIVAYLKKE